MAYSVLKLTPTAREVLTGSRTVTLAKPRAIKKAPKKRKVAAVIADLSEQDQALFNTLRLLRKELAQSQGVPPHVVFGDKTLKQMALHKPSTPSAFLELSGVGSTKLKKYGPTFLETIAGFDTGAEL